MLLPNCQTGGEPQKMHSGWSAHPILTGAPCQLAGTLKKANSNFLHVVILLGTLRDIKSLPALNLFQMMEGHDLQEEIRKEMRIAPLQHYLSCALALDMGHLSSYSR